MKLYLFLLLACIFFSDGLAAQLSPSNLDEDWEHWSETVKISAGVRKGFMSSVDDSRLNPDTFYVWKPEERIETICVLVRTNDGLYTAEMRFNVVGEARGFVKLVWPTQHAAKLRKYQRDQISMIGTIGESCDVTGFLTACTFVPTEDVKVVTFWLKTNGRTEFIASDATTKKDTMQTCVRLARNERTKGVNCRCDVPLTFFQNGRRYFIREKSEGQAFGTSTSYELKIIL